MIGNDVVDLTHPVTQRGARHVRFDARVFVREERDQIAASGAPERLRWMLWAAKEAAYKALKREHPETIWSPRRFVVSLGANLKGSVVYDSYKLAVRIEESGETVHAIAADSEHALANPLFEIAKRSETEDESAAVRACAKTSLGPLLGVSSERLSIERNERIPILCCDGLPLDVDLSLSHHGRYVAWAAELGPDQSELPGGHA